MTHNQPQTLSDIKHEAGHDMNRLAQMIADLRREFWNSNEAYNAKVQELAGDRALAAKQLSAAQEEINTQAATITTLREEINSHRANIAAQMAIIENHQEEIALMSEDITSLRRELCEQAQLTSSTALQVAEARRAEAHVEREYRAFIQDKSREFELLQTELRKLDKLKKELTTYRNECRKLIDENTELQLRVNAKWIFARPRAYISRLRNRISPVEA